MAQSPGLVWKPPETTHYPVRRGWDEVSTLYDLIGDRGWIAGGFAAWMGSEHDDPILPSDIDIFAVSNEAAWAITQEICALRNWAWDVSPIAYTCKPNKMLNFYGEQDTRRTIQVIMPDPKWIKLWESYEPKEGDISTLKPQIILNSFDFDVCRGLLLSPEVVIGDPNMGGKDARILVIRNPVQNMRRVIKYSRKGVRFDEKELYKLFWAYESINETRRSQIRDMYCNDMEGRWHGVRIEIDNRWFTNYTFLEETLPADDFSRLTQAILEPANPPQIDIPFMPIEIQDVDQDIPF
jgi:hypothetical protein